MSLPFCLVKPLAIGAALLSASIAGAADSTGRRDPLQGADRYIEQVRADWKNVGAAVAVVRGAEVLYVRGFGLRETGRTEPVTPETLFQIGSTTKAFTTAALGILVDEGKIAWDDPIIKHVPEFQLQDPWLTRHVTLRDAVTHRSGVPDNYYAYLAHMDDDAVVRQLRYLTPEGEFRASFRYNNLMYAAAGKVIQAAAGMSWHDFVAARLLKPLQMTRSGTSANQFWDPQNVADVFFGSARVERPSLDQARDSNLAMPHGLAEDGSVAVRPWLTFDNAAPAGSIVASASDMANWLILHLNEGRFAGQQLLQADTVRQLHAAQNPQMRRSVFPLDNVQVAMGWFRGGYQGHMHVAHSGGIIGFPAYVALLPEQKLGVVVLANGPVELGDDYKFHRSIAFWVFDRLLGVPVRDWRMEFLTQLRDSQQQAEKSAEQLRRSRLPDAPPSLPLEKYAGDYEDENVPSGLVLVRVENGRLTLRFAGAGAFSGYLEHWHHDLFRLHSNAPGHNTVELGFTDFAVDPLGNVASISVGSAYFNFTLKRVKPPEAGPLQ